jgi:transposase
MKIIGCDFHPSFQQIAMVDTETGEYTERKLIPAEAQPFYSELKREVVVGMESCGNTLWLERLLAGLGHELRLGDAAKIRAMEVRKQKTDRRDAELLLRLLLEGRFPQLWVPSPEQRDTRQLLLHRHKLVKMRRQVKNELQHLALNQGIQRKSKLWSAAGRKLLEELPLTGWTARRRQDSLQLLDDLDRRIAELDIAAQQEAEKNPVAQLLQTHPGVGPITSLALAVTLGQIERFCLQPQGGQLPGAQSHGAFQRRPTAAGRDQQARQCHGTQFVGGSGTQRSPLCSGVETCLSAAQAQKAFCSRQGHGGAQIGGAAVLDMENPTALLRRSHAG